MINVADVVNDPDFNQPFVIHRTQGAFGAGGWVSTLQQDIQARGVIEVASDKALQQVPEGDRVEGSMQVWSTIPIYLTSADHSGISDTITWRNQLYRVQSVAPWMDYGYQSAILARMSGK